ncbi:MAG: hypothetical protein AVDCRST_MAG54-1037, partial [uncultured Actinomycetospora sp.]
VCRRQAVADRCRRGRPALLRHRPARGRGGRRALDRGHHRQRAVVDRDVLPLVVL